MNKRKVLLKRILSLTILACGMLVNGCSTWRAYSGPSLPRNTVAILKSRFGPTWLYIVFVDGRDTSKVNWDGSHFTDPFGRIENSRPYATEVELLPGHHRITFFPQAGQGTDSITEDVYVEAGKTYLANMTIHNLQTDYGAHTSFSHGTWNVVITERRQKHRHSINFPKGVSLYY